MRSKSLIALLALFFGARGVLPRTAFAQQRYAPALDLTIGLGGSGGGTYDARAATSVDALLSARVRSSAIGRLVLAVSAAAQSTYDGSDVCLLAPGGGCVPNFPSMSSIGALAGLESGAPRHGSAALMVGPSFFFGGSERTLGLQGRLDLVTPALGPLALVLSARGSTLPSFHDERVALWTLGLGLRIQ